ncbi:MAG: isoleucine--tRNA ligase, partial [Candidatus Omnitrophica bacterium]|nr:isoleucine--tRNA ligase [Candidatus Omnitrophota bacterium]
MNKKADTNSPIDYRKTLNLPKTDFSMRAGLIQKEPEFLKKWQDDALYKEIRQKPHQKKPFILHDGPPYANGDIHIGHALNKILKDIIVKAKTMEGFDCLYIPGWDCHGLPIEHKLLKEQKKKKSDVDCVEFRKSAHDYALKYVDIQREQFKRLGIFGQWDDPYLTLKPEYEFWILKSLAELNQKGYIYRGLKPVNWCFQCETALAEAEVEYENHVSSAVFVKFKINNPERLKGLPDKPLSVVIWTTTPWTLVANVAVAVHEAFQYSVLDLGEECVIMERSLARAALNKAGYDDVKSIQEVSGKDLTPLTYEHPFGIKTNCRIVAADYVTKEDGTGLVHTAPGHGQDDFITGQKNQLDVLMPVNDKGVYTDQAGELAGQHVFKANQRILETLEANGQLFAQEKLEHSYPHCWRCKNPIIFRATKQWFLKIDHEGLREKLINVSKDDVQWIPPAGKERISAMVAGRPDWCLSRQRFWGVPIPALKPKGSEEYYLYSDVIENFAEIVRKEGTNAWFEKDIKDIIPKGFKCPNTGDVAFDKSLDILDVWFDSGVSHVAVSKGMN